MRRVGHFLYGGATQVLSGATGKPGNEERVPTQYMAKYISEFYRSLTIQLKQPAAK